MPVESPLDNHDQVDTFCEVRLIRTRNIVDGTRYPISSAFRTEPVYEIAVSRLRILRLLYPRSLCICEADARFLSLVSRSPTAPGTSGENGADMAMGGLNVIVLPGQYRNGGSTDGSIHHSGSIEDVHLQVDHPRAVRIVVFELSRRMKTGFRAPLLGRKTDLGCEYGPR